MRKLLTISFLIITLFCHSQVPGLQGFKRPGVGGGTDTSWHKCSGTPVYSTGYNTVGDLDPFGHGQLGNGSLSSTIKHEGCCSFHSVPQNVSSGYRSEVQYNNGPGGQTPDEGIVDYWVYYETIVQNNCHSIQWHPETSGGSAALALWHIDGNFDVTRWRAGTNTHQVDIETPANSPQGILPIVANHWYHMTVQYRFHQTLGYIHWYIDGNLYFNVNNTFVGDGSGQYLKVGVNIFNGTPASSIYYDQLSICTP